MENGYFDSREKAKRHIMAGNVIINDKLVDKAGTMFNEQDIKDIRIKQKLEYVSRGGLKLKGAIEIFDIDFSDKIVLDIGASTGGFTDCSLQHGAKIVYSVDVGTNQLDYKLRNDNRVISIENTHINSLDINVFNGRLPDIVVCDVSFISLTKISKYIYNFSNDFATAVLLIKPQFEVGRDKIGKNGIVTEKKYRDEAIQKVKDEFESLGYSIQGICESPIKGTKGNIEYLIYIRKEKNGKNS